MPIEKNEALAGVAAPTSAKQAEFEHDGQIIKVEYMKPTVAMINSARDKAMTINQKGRRVDYRINIFDFEVNLLKSALRDSNIPGVPQGGELALRSITDTQLWNKLLVACEIKSGETSGDEVLEAAQAVVDELGLDNPVVARLAQALEGDQLSDEADAKKS